MLFVVLSSCRLHLDLTVANSNVDVPAVVLRYAFTNCKSANDTGEAIGAYYRGSGLLHYLLRTHYYSSSLLQTCVPMGTTTGNREGIGVKHSSRQPRGCTTSQRRETGWNDPRTEYSIHCRLRTTFHAMKTVPISPNTARSN